MLMPIAFRRRWPYHKTRMAPRYDTDGRILVATTTASRGAEAIPLRCQYDYQVGVVNERSHCEASLCHTARCF